jgi:hypothetical protein
MLPNPVDTTTHARIFKAIRMDDGMSQEKTERDGGASAEE